MLNSFTKNKIRFIILAVFAVLLVSGIGWSQLRLTTKQAGNKPAADTRPANHLAGSTSPYLLQHSHNPVDWYPWGKEALELAKRENKPIFLSIGYSACHWCHVMEREDFENSEIAKLMNANFVCIKVDREERPDIDSQYILAVEMLNGSAGWPMSVWLTPDLKPFYGGTYYPADQFKPLIEKIGALWHDDPARVKAAADQISLQMQQITESLTRKSTAALPSNVVEQALVSMLRRYDKVHGGFGARPKFPEVPDVKFILEEYRRTNRPDLLAVLTKTLDSMAYGGIYDQIGGGFHRYSTDDHWLVPHFEKMLYDEAQLARLYFDAYEATKKPLYKRIGRETLDFVLREMTDTKTGGFYSTLDADSAGKEGEFYVWSPVELKAVLGSTDAISFANAYGVTSTGTFDTGRSVLALKGPLSPEQEKSFAPLRAKLLAVRNKRIRPNTDDKILTAWNGLMITAMARGFEVTGDTRYRDAAARSADFIKGTMTKPDGELLRGAREGKAGIVSGFIDDYAYYAEGLQALYDVTYETLRFHQARTVIELMIRKYWDKDGDGGFLTKGPHGSPVLKMKDGQDNATPSPNGVAAQVLIRLAELPSADRPASESAHLRQQAAQTVQVFGSTITRSPAAFPTLLIAWQTLKKSQKPVTKPVSSTKSPALIPSAKKK